MGVRGRGGCEGGGGCEGRGGWEGDGDREGRVGMRGVCYERRDGTVGVRTMSGRVVTMDVGMVLVPASS